MVLLFHHALWVKPKDHSYSLYTVHSTLYGICFLCPSANNCLRTLSLLLGYTAMVRIRGMHPKYKAKTERIQILRGDVGGSKG